MGDTLTTTYLPLHIIVGSSVYSSSEQNAEADFSLTVSSSTASISYLSTSQLSASTDATSYSSIAKLSASATAISYLSTVPFTSGAVSSHELMVPSGQNAELGPSTLNIYSSTASMSYLSTTQISGGATQSYGMTVLDQNSPMNSSTLASNLNATGGQFSLSTVAGEAVTLPNTEVRLMMTTPSTMPSNPSAELERDYEALGDVLGTMSELESDDEWWVEAGVLTLAQCVAAKLKANAYPAPEILTHGPKSVVYNWTYDDNNVYLTISTERLSALVSSHERIERRIDMPMKAALNTELLLPSLQYITQEEPVAFSTERKSERIDSVG
jgi:hypothetical protein